jgi:peptidoglycan/xylan/chitin deacetylase (PgdA/CDA1 family)
MRVLILVVIAGFALFSIYCYAWSIPTLQVFGPALVRGPRADRRVALTFDDGPAAVFTEQVLDVLRDRKVKATFFLCGKNVERYPEIARRIKAEGHAIGNHTYSHPFLYFRSRSFMGDEIDRAQDAIARVTGERPALFRPPYGARWLGIYDVLRDRHLTLVNWSDTGYDWKYGSDRIVSEALDHLGPGSIILLHDGLESRPQRPINQSATVRALPAIIDAARAAGYTFVTVPDFLDGGRSGKSEIRNQKSEKKSGLGP